MRYRHLLMVLLTALLATTASAGTGNDFGALAPLTKIIDFATGDVARAIGTLALVGLGFTWLRESDRERGEKVARWAIAVAIIFGAPQIMGALGFTGATF